MTTAKQCAALAAELRNDWEEDIYNLLCERLEVSRGDAQGIAEQHLDQLWFLMYDAYDAVEYIIDNGMLK